MTSTLNPSIVGQAEKAHSAILLRALAGTAVDETQWIVLNMAAVPEPRSDLVARVAAATHFDPAAVEAAIDGVTAAGLIGPLPGQGLGVTTEGRAFVDGVRRSTGEVVARAYGGIGDEDLATAAGVLVTITARLSEELATG